MDLPVIFAHYTEHRFYKAGELGPAGDIEAGLTKPAVLVEDLVAWLDSRPVQTRLHDELKEQLSKEPEVITRTI